MDIPGNLPPIWNSEMQKLLNRPEVKGPESSLTAFTQAVLSMATNVTINIVSISIDVYTSLHDGSYTT